MINEKVLIKLEEYVESHSDEHAETIQKLLDLYEYRYMLNDNFIENLEEEMVDNYEYIRDHLNLREDIGEEILPTMEELLPFIWNKISELNPHTSVHLDSLTRRQLKSILEIVVENFKITDKV